MTKFINTLKVGEFGVNKEGKKYEVIERIRRGKFKIRYLDTGFETETWSANLYKGAVRDRYAPTSYGVGIVGDFRDYKDPHYHKIFSHWLHMLRRCYDTEFKQYHNYGGEGVTVCERWKRFDYFYDDFRKIDGYSEEIMKLKGKRHLDKDKKQTHLPHNQRVYSLETCTLVTQEENEKDKREEPRPYNKVINPAGTVFYINHIIEFSKTIRYLVRPKYIHYCLSGERDNHLGWKFYRVDEEEYNEFHRLNPETPEYPQEEDLIVIPSAWTDTSPEYVKIYDPTIHTPRYSQTLIK